MNCAGLDSIAAQARFRLAALVELLAQVLDQPALLDIGAYDGKT